MRCVSKTQGNNVKNQWYIQQALAYYAYDRLQFFPFGFNPIASVWKEF
jgi:hypothetical protein